jgi:O-acetyl-ADP-ribose deacetylase (regulator of RNase III)
MTLFAGGRIEVVRGDITTLDVDVVVNAANAALCGGGGVDGAIHRAAGPELLVECRALGGARIGDVKLTKGHRLRARFIAHAVGPVWSGGDAGEDAVLAGVYERALALAVEQRASSIAFPCISTGAYRFPLERAARIALDVTSAHLAREPSLARVVFCCFNDREARVYEKLATRIADPR